MQALEIETMIDPQGDIHLPKKYRNLYGKRASLIVLLPDHGEKSAVTDPMQFADEEEYSNSPVTEGEKLLSVLQEEGLIGCLHGDGGASVNYKKALWDN